MRVLVTGGRTYNNRDLVERILDVLNPSYLVTGDAEGADELAWDWVVSQPFPPDADRMYALWDVHGKAAGPIRNKKMLDEGDPDLVLAFPGGKGTADMVRQAKAAGIPVLQCS